MAEAFGLAASCFSILQLTLECGSKLHEFCRDMGDAAKELESITSSVKSLSASLNILHKLTSLDLLPPGVGSVCTTDALFIIHEEIRRCEAVVLELSNIISDLEAAKSSCSTTKKRIHAFKFALRKGIIKELQDKVEQAKTGVLLAKSSYDCALQTIMANQLHRIEQNLITPTSNTPIAANVQALESQIRRSTDGDTAFLSPCNMRRCQCQCHAVAFRSGRFWSMQFPNITTLWNSCNRADCANRQHLFSFRVSLTPLGIKRAAIFVTSLSLAPTKFFISPSLRIDRAVDYTAPGFVLLWKYQTGQISLKAFKKDIVQAIQSGNSHISDVDPAGAGWLEKIISGFQIPAWERLELIHLFIKIGAPVNRIALLYRCVKWIGEGPHLHYLKALVNSDRFDTSEIESPTLALWPQPCDSNWISERNTPDPLFINLMKTLVQNDPEFGGTSPTMEAIFRGSYDDFHIRLNKYNLITDINFLGQSSLHLAVVRTKSDFRQIDQLLEAGIDIDKPDYYGLTPLMYAATYGNSEAVVHLLSQGANPFYSSNLYKRTFLHYASTYGHWQLIFDTLTWMKSYPEYPERICQAFLKLGLILWAMESHFDIDTDIESVEALRLERLQVLLQLGADPNINIWGQDSKDNTILHEMNQHGFPNESEIRCLIDTGFVKLNHENSNGITPLSAIVASSSNSPPLIDYLIQSGCEVNRQDTKGLSVLHHSLLRLSQSYGSLASLADLKDTFSAIEVIRILLANGADTSKSDCCVCPCSPEGCWPGSYLVGRAHHGFSLKRDIWTLEWLALVTEKRSDDELKKNLLAMLRVARFEQLGLTHVCCRGASNDILDGILDDRGLTEQRVSEINIEEMNLIRQLDNELEDLCEKGGEELMQLWLDFIKDRMMNLKKEKRQWLEKEPQTPSRPSIEYRVDTRNDSLTQIFNTSVSYSNPSIGLKDYLKWMGYVARKQRSMGKDKEEIDQLLFQRRSWVSQLGVFH